ncbi:MAG: hypothetical protein WKG00_00380 [Polyangiaceae bacterium]
MRRTIPDWLTHAAAAADRSEAARCLDAAIAQASSCHDWRTLLRGIAEIPLITRERVADLAQRTLESAHAEGDVWGFRDVAAVCLARLQDEAGARAALEAGFTLFRGPAGSARGDDEAFGEERRARGYQWVLLGRGFLETLRDEPGLLRCLEAGRDQARASENADDLCSIATEWAKRVDGSAGAALLVEAEALNTNGAAAPWTLANAWNALDDRASVQRVLDGALGRASSSAAAVHVARAWASHGVPEEAGRALDRARELARTAPEWLEIGECAFDVRLGEGAVRSAVERAETLARGDDITARVASAYSHWLHDPAAAARVGPRGVRPEALRKRLGGLPDWPSSASALFDWLRARATPEALRSIASADYVTNVDKHHAALRDICETGLVPRTLGWEPHEVLALARWASGESVEHLERALCCTLLCLAPDDMDELVTNGAILAESCLALGPEPSQLAERFFAWHADSAPCAQATGAGDEPPGASRSQPARPEPASPPAASPDQPVALLLLFLLRTASTPDDPRLEPLSLLLTDHPSFELDTVAGWMAESMRAEIWTELIDSILVPRRATDARVDTVLRALGR